jgi:hypothetical protein
MVDFQQEARGMLIANISSTSSNVPLFNPALASRSSQGATTSAAASTAPSSASSPTVPSSDATEPSSVPSNGSAQPRSAVSATLSSALVEQLISGYSTTVGGKQYSGSVEESDGEYTASVPNLAGATATRSIEQAAENNLHERIDELV